MPSGGREYGEDADARLAAAVIAAFKTVVNWGLIPQAKHGESGVEPFAVEASKLEGIGLENEHIGHIQVEVLREPVLPCNRKGLPLRECGEDDPPGDEDLAACGIMGLTPA